MDYPLTDKERSLWEKYFLRLKPIADEFNIKTWPSDTSTDTDRAQYIATFCYVWDVTRGRQKEINGQ